ncbi:porin family protein [Haliangium sp.]|uniref:porin family protein n=1 Tax=Haliangium sp. TaxID=2663208 RepID=UPI003D105073
MIRSLVSYRAVSTAEVSARRPAPARPGAWAHAVGVAVIWVLAGGLCPGLAAAQGDATPADGAAPAASVATSAPDAPRRWSGGVVAGVGFNDMLGDVDADVYGTMVAPSPEAAEGISAGGFLTVQFTPQWGARAEVRYSERGATAGQSAGGFGGAGGGYAFDFTLAYVEVPILLTYSLAYDDSFVPFVFAGPDLALLISSEVTGSGSQTDDMGAVLYAFDATKDVEEATSSYDFGATVGAGMKFPLPSGKLVLDARYSIGFTEAVGEGETELVENVRLLPHGLRHHGLSLSAAYEF